MRPLENVATALASDCCSHTGPNSCQKSNQCKRDLYRDPLGYYWCKAHHYRGELLLWGSQHDYPHIAFYGRMRYAIGDDTCRPDDRQSLWEKAILLGTDDMILAAYRYVWGELEEI